MYLVVSHHAVSSVLLRQQEGVQRPIFYPNKTLVDVETRYLPFGKNCTSTDACHEETIALFPSSYGLGVDRVLLAITFEEVGFY